MYVGMNTNLTSRRRHPRPLGLVLALRAPRTRHPACIAGVPVAAFPWAQEASFVLLTLCVLALAWMA